MHALIFEQDPAISATVEQALREQGFSSVSIVRDAVEAIESARCNSPDFVIAGSLDGVGAVRAICLRQLLPLLILLDHPAPAGCLVDYARILMRPVLPTMLAEAVDDAIANAHRARRYHAKHRQSQTGLFRRPRAPLRRGGN